MKGDLLEQYEMSIENPHQIQHAELINVVLQLNNIQYTILFILRGKPCLLQLAFLQVFHG